MKMQRRGMAELAGSISILLLAIMSLPGIGTHRLF